MSVHSFHLLSNRPFQSPGAYCVSWNVHLAKLVGTLVMLYSQIKRTSPSMLPFLNPISYELSLAGTSSCYYAVLPVILT